MTSFILKGTFMKKSVRNWQYLTLCIAGYALLPPTNASASSAFTSYATLTYTINSIVNNVTPGDLSALVITGSFEQSVADSVLTGDGAISDTNPNVGPLTIVGNTFSNTFAVNGSVSNGTVASHHLGNYVLSFVNNGTDDYSINVTLAYTLSADASGEGADSDVTLDYFNADYSFSGYNAVNASVFGTPTNSVTDSAIYSFALPGSSYQNYSADVVINGTLQATAVPIPAASWLFISSLAGLIALGKRKLG